MGLSFYNNENQLLKHFSDQESMVLDQKIFQILNENYSIHIDLFSDFKLYNNHIEKIIEIGTSQIDDRVILEFINFLSDCINKKISIKLIGD